MSEINVEAFSSLSIKEIRGGAVGSKSTDTRPTPNYCFPTLIPPTATMNIFFHHYMQCFSGRPRLISPHYDDDSSKLQVILNNYTIFPFDHT